MIRFLLVTAVTTVSLFSQGAVRGIPDLTAEQTAAINRMTADLAPQTEALTRARKASLDAAFGESSAAIQAAAEAVGAAELALAQARAEALERLQASPAKLAPNQIAALIAVSARAAGPAAVGHGTVPHIREAQTVALTRLTTGVLPLVRALTSARAELTAAAFAQPRDNAAIRAKAEAVQRAELAVATARAAAFAKIQGSNDKLTRDQVATFIAMGGSFANLPFTQPEPMNFDDHEGYVSLFDGVSLKGWDGNPKFWRAEGGAIIGESTAQNPSGNTYLVYRGMEAKDFTLKFEMKIEGKGGSGFQYRSKTGLPWLSNIADNVTANVGPVNLNWMLTGPQADFWPSARDYTGQFYSENNPMRIIAWRGQVVESAGLSRKQLMGNIGDRQALGGLVKMEDWNQYTVIARGGTCLHILNGQLMAVLVDDDPESSNNQSGLFGIEIEAITKVSVRNIWVRKLH